MTQWLRVLVALSEALYSVLSTHMSITAVSRGCDALFWSPWTLDIHDVGETLRKNE